MVDVFHNRRLLQNIWMTSNSKMDIHCNAGIAITDMVGELPGYCNVWYHPEGIANIISFSKAKEHGLKNTFDSSIGNVLSTEKMIDLYAPFNNQIKDYII
jgi:hypothetical protein